MLLRLYIYVAPIQRNISFSELFEKLFQKQSPSSLFSSNQLKGKKGTNGVASKQKAEPKNQSKKNGVNGTNGTASLKRNNSSK